MTAKTRFRHKNSLYTGTGHAWLKQVAKAGGNCDNPIQVLDYYKGVLPTRKLGKVSYMVDTYGDPPLKKEGPRGFKFHPMTQVKCEINGVGFGSWSTKVKTQECLTSPPNGKEYNVQYFTSHVSGYDQNVAWAGFDHKMIGDQLDLVQYGIPWSDLEVSKDLAATYALSKRGRVGESNLYESLAEIRKTVNMFSDILNRARKIQDAIFSKYATAKSRKRVFSEEAAGQLLMTNYGWKPLMSDINGVLVGLEKAIGSQIHSSRGTHSGSRTTNTLLPDVNDSDSVMWGRSITSQEEWTARAVSVDQFNVSVLDNLGLSVKDLILVPWELIRYSHVVDWFLNVGDLLGAIVQDPSLLNLGQSCSVRYKRTDVCSFSYKGQPPGRAGYYDVLSASPPPTVTRVFEYYDRQTGPLVPQLRLRPDHLDLMKVLNALAMFTVATAKVKGEIRKYNPPGPATVKDVRFSKDLRTRIWNGRLPSDSWVG